MYIITFQNFLKCKICCKAKLKYSLSAQQWWQKIKTINNLQNLRFFPTLLWHFFYTRKAKNHILDCLQNPRPMQKPWIKSKQFITEKNKWHLIRKTLVIKNTVSLYSHFRTRTSDDLIKERKGENSFGSSGLDWICATAKIIINKSDKWSQKRNKSLQKTDI